jgi:HEAT repeat protein
MSKVKETDDKQDLFRDLKSADERRRQYAVRALSKSVTAREVSSFVHNLRPYHWQGKLGAIKLLGKLGDEVSVEKLKAFILDFNPRVREAARRTLVKLGVTDPYTDDDVAELVSYLDHPSWWVRSNAIKALAALKDKRAVEPISQKLLDEDEYVREAAKEAVAALTRKPK